MANKMDELITKMALDAAIGALDIANGNIADVPSDEFAWEFALDLLTDMDYLLATTVYGRMPRIFADAYNRAIISNASKSTR